MLFPYFHFISCFSFPFSFFWPLWQNCMKLQLQRYHYTPGAFQITIKYRPCRLFFRFQNHYFITGEICYKVVSAICFSVKIDYLNPLILASSFIFYQAARSVIYAINSDVFLSYFIMLHVELCKGESQYNIQSSALYDLTHNIYFLNIFSLLFHTLLYSRSFQEKTRLSLH